MNKIYEALKNKKAFIPFITCGDPDVTTTKAAILEMVKNGADLIEIGIRRLLQRFGDVQVAVAPFFPVTIAFIGARQLPPAWVEQAGIAGDHPGAQRRDGDVRFYR